jgi:hypothetical protein
MSVHFQLIAHTGSDPLALSHTPFSNSHRQPLCRSMCYIPMALEAGNKIEKRVKLGYVFYARKNVPNYIIKVHVNYHVFCPNSNCRPRHVGNKHTC